jgi:hypothetical protein
MRGVNCLGCCVERLGCESEDIIMAMIHYLYTGHFIPHEGFVRFDANQFVADRTIDSKVVANLLKKYLGDAASPESLPEHWGMSILPDHIVCFESSPRPALEFIADYAQETEAMIVDMGSFSLKTPDQLRERFHTVQTRQLQSNSSVERPQPKFETPTP